MKNGNGHQQPPQQPPVGKKAGDLARRQDIPMEMHLRTPIPGPDGEPVSVLKWDFGRVQWALASIPAPFIQNPQQVTLVPAYQVQIIGADDVGWACTVPVEQVVCIRSPVRRLLVDEPLIAPIEVVR